MDSVDIDSPFCVFTKKEDIYCSHPKSVKLPASAWQHAPLLRSKKVHSRTFFEIPQWDFSHFLSGSSIFPHFPR
jgi:hypothetical protein